MTHLAARGPAVASDSRADRRAAGRAGATRLAGRGLRSGWLSGAEPFAAGAVVRTINDCSAAALRPARSSRGVSRKSEDFSEGDSDAADGVSAAEPEGWLLGLPLVSAGLMAPEPRIRAACRGPPAGQGLPPGARGTARGLRADECYAIAAVTEYSSSEFIRRSTASVAAACQSLR